MSEVIASAGFIAGIIGIATIVGVFSLITLAELGVRAAWAILGWIREPSERSAPMFNLRSSASLLPSQRP